MRLFLCFAFSFFALLMVITASCSFNNEDGPEVHIVIGEASLRRNGKIQQVSPGLKLKLWDSLSVARGSKVKINAGSGSVYVNERSSVLLTRGTGTEEFAFTAHSGELYFVTRDGSGVVCRAGDAFISIRNADAAVSVTPAAQTAQIAVLNGDVSINRSGEETRVASCTKALVESAGPPQKEVILTDELERLREWVGKSVIEKAAALSGCRPLYAAAEQKVSGGDMTAGTADTAMATATVSVIMEESPQKFARPKPAVVKQADTAALADSPVQPVQPDTPAVVKTPEPVPVFAPVKAPKITVDYLSGPRQAFAGQDIVFKCNIGSGVPKEFLWRFKLGDEIIERKSSQPLVSVKLEKTGDYAVRCDVTGEKGGRVSQQIAVKIVNSPVIVNAGGPYKATVNNPVKFKGGAQSGFSNIVLYEWYVSGSQTPGLSSATPAVFDYTFTQAGKHQVVLSARAANGVVGSDTVIVDVGMQPPLANAGGDIVSKPGRKVKLRGTGTVPGGGEIVKYEWDFYGSGVYDWSSANNGAVDQVFDSYSTPVLRVTNSLGVSATDTARVVICPAGMVTAERGKFCIDEYEWPNSRGAVPHTNISWHEAAQACESVGKRLCGGEEWQRACRNDRTQKQAGRHAYPYGTDFDENRCNTIGNFKTKNKLSASGAYHDCGGSISAFDMSGNAAEWVSSKDGASASAYGGFYQSGASESNCDSHISLDKNRKYFYVGFRCCK